MSKYEPLKSYLLESKAEHLPMSFEDIESLLGFNLPPSKKYPAWWSNSPTNNVMTKQWLDAGYETESVNVEAGHLVFRRVRAPKPDGTPSLLTPPASGGSAAAGDSDHVHPLIGSMKGLITFYSDVDLTEPADPDWGRPD